MRFDEFSKIQKIKDNQNNIFVKREDLIPIVFGGNKARKGIKFINEIKKNNYKTVVTYGSKDSNHCRVIAGLCAENNLECILIIPRNGKNENFNGNILLSSLFGVKVVECEINCVKETINDLMLKLKKDNKKAYFIQGGGHGNLGVDAYVDAYMEINRQCRKNNIKFDYIFFASGTGTTHAGLEVGKRILNGNEEIIGISIARKEEYGKKVVMDSINEYIQDNSLEIKIENINFIDDYLLGGYGCNKLSLKNLIKRIASNEGLILDPIYTGKAYYGMTEYIKKKNIKNKNILFIHTGGIPIIYNYANLFS